MHPATDAGINAVMRISIRRRNKIEHMQQLQFMHEVSGILNRWYVAVYMGYNSKIRSLEGSI